ncbi:glycine cleavage system protein R [Sinimarinibacterium sp. NLF-5-8]|uniref:glycine cleavage system protein R n=1 Tax=Sinimarinibacterium sp. NLF-5-8 TaxID=2698684 RepID=UPI00137BDF21|nr:ACT domain-containing protein [Sinimarinibacterium sp. NLF-5-8]QHS09460.1 amino acid-binding protein [Sinimarinibacterium sp. NLF-5-8]
MTPSDNLLTISAIGKPSGNVPLELFKAIRERGGEIDDCRISQIGDRLAANMLVSGNWSTLGRLETAMPGVAEKLGLTIRMERSEPRPTMPEFRPYGAEVIAPQDPNLLVNILEFYQHQEVRVVEISSQRYQSSYTGAGMMTIQMVLHVPVNHHPQALRESFMDLCDDLNADGLLDPIKT